MKKLILQVAVLSISTILFSCQEVSKRPKITDLVTTAQDEALAESFFEDANQESSQQHESTEDGAIKSFEETGPVITIDSGENGFQDSAWMVTVDFGDGITGRNGWVRKGKIVIDIYGRYKTEGSKRTMTFVNYYVNDNKIEGTHIVENLGFDSTEMCYNFSVLVENGIVTTPEGKQITWESERNRRWIAGYDTPGLNVFDDVYEITGEAHGINSEGKTYSKTITEALLVQVGCPYIQEGKLTVSIDNSDDVIIDYGYAEDAEECNNDGEITYNGQKYQYKLRAGK